jgi:Na+/H+ antiporter NhaA
MTISCMSNYLEGTCGVSVVYSFTNGQQWYFDELKGQGLLGGIGYSVAGFVNTLVCKEAYQQIKRHYQIVFQSPVKRNANSGRKFFFIVFKAKD